jgi:serine O-acetyltransferase
MVAPFWLHLQTEVAHFPESRKDGAASKCRPPDGPKMADKPHTSKRLESILDALVESYEGPEVINNLETYALPNRRRVIEAFSHIQHMLFLGFFSTRPLSSRTLRLALGEHLLPAQEILCEQIHRAATWQDRDKPPEEHRSEQWCREVVYRLLEKLPAIRGLLAGDVQATYDHDPAAASLEEVVFSYPGIRAIMAYRVAHALVQEGVPMIPRILTEFAHTRTGIDIHPAARIGERFFIDHGTGVVVGATTDIGDDVKLYQGVTLGAMSISPDIVRDAEDGHKRHPTLEDRVTVYAGATILGGDTVVGADSVIGGNVWLTRSVPPGSKIYHRPEQTD